MPNNYFIEVLDPENPSGPKKKATIPYDLILHYYKRLETRYDQFIEAKYVLENTSRLFGRCRLLSDGMWCYSGRPETWHVKPGVIAPFPKELVFAVYLNDRLIVYEFGAEPADPGDPYSPKDYKTRFGELKWKSTS